MTLAVQEAKLVYLIMILKQNQRSNSQCFRYGACCRCDIRSRLCSENVHALEGLAGLAASVSLQLACLPPLPPQLQAGGGAHVAYAPRLRLRQAFSRMLWLQNSKR